MLSLGVRSCCAAGRRDENDFCAGFFPPVVECPELGDAAQQRSHEYSKGNQHLAVAPRFGRRRRRRA